MSDSLWHHFHHASGFELRISQEALDYIASVLTTPYLRIGANKGGCSGWLYTVEPVEQWDEQKDICLDINEKLSVVVDAQQATELLHKIDVFMKSLSFGVQLKIAKQEKGVECGCGESFQ